MNKQKSKKNRWTWNFWMCRCFQRRLGAFPLILVALLALFFLTTFALMLQLETSLFVLEGKNSISGLSNDKKFTEMLVFVDPREDKSSSVQEEQVFLSSPSFRKATRNRVPFAVTNQTDKSSHKFQGSTSDEFSAALRGHKNDARLLPPLPPFVKYLGVLVDAGRHFFPLKWLYHYLLPHLHVMDYNYVHFRLTDDQNFVLNLTVTVPYGNNQKKDVSLGFAARHQSAPGVYQPQELREFVRYAKEHYNIVIIPEINLPGHGGAWGASEELPELIVQCPEYACSNGYGIPLNVSHPLLATILKQVLSQVVNIFDFPPMLHLGGDELHMSKPCLQEHHSRSIDINGSSLFNMTEWMSEEVYHFEEKVLKPILKDLGYGSDQIVRWETTDTGATYSRVGKIVHYWEKTPLTNSGTLFDNRKQQSTPGITANTTAPYIASTGLYLDVISTNGYGYVDYLAARALVSEETKPFAVVVGTFELSTDTWEDRNVLGRLLGIRMGASTDQSDDSTPTQENFRSVYISTCKKVFALPSEARTLAYNYTKMCDLAGFTRMDDRSYQLKWKDLWKEWKLGLCKGITVVAKELRIQPMAVDADLQQRANYIYFDHLVLPTATAAFELQPYKAYPPKLKDTLAMHKVPNVGIFLDLIEIDISLESFGDLMEILHSLQMNFVHLRLSGHFGQVVDFESLPEITYSAFVPKNKSHSTRFYRQQHLKQFAKAAKRWGIKIMPEINLATNGGGWVKTGMLLNCPLILCHHADGVAFDVINKLGSILPVVVAAVREIIHVFSSPLSISWVHMGADDRARAAQGCFAEAGYGVQEAQEGFRIFEDKLSTALALHGIDQDNIVRWSNDENVHYSKRTGQITQHLSSYDTSSLDPESLYFGTVSVSDDTAWKIFCNTRKWLVKSNAPTGLVLMSANGGIPSIAHMTAFIMALSATKLSEIKQEGFEGQYKGLCSQVDCNAKEAILMQLRALSQKSPSTVSTVCSERTVNVTMILPKLSSMGSQIMATNVLR
jgi:hypothetical protein